MLNTVLMETLRRKRLNLVLTTKQKLRPTRNLKTRLVMMIGAKVELTLVTCYG